MTTHHSPPPDELSDFAELMRHEEEVLDPATFVDPAVRRRRRRRGLIITAIILVVLLGVPSAYIGWALTAPVSDPELSAQTPPPVPLQSAALLRLPAEGSAAISVSGADEYLGPAASGIWQTSGTNDPQPIASITKLVTALVILNAKPLAGPGDPGPTITFDKADHDLYDEYYVMGATIAAMPTGSTMSLHDALAMMLIPSASNYADAVSTWAFGSQGAFLRATRDWLAANGLTGTTIVEPTGISPRNTSTPSDLIALGKIAAAHPVIAPILAKPALALPGLGVMHNTNSLLGRDGVTGLKTGNLGAGTYNLLYSATLDVGAAQPLSVIGVRLGGGSRGSVDADVLATLDSIRYGFHEVELVQAGVEVGTYTTAWGETAQVVVSKTASVFTWSDTAITSTVSMTPAASYEDGEIVGSITWTAGPHTATVPLEIEGEIDPPTEWWRLTHPAELWAP
jgi:serine-type D-Ala-D-Ala carboxypeptidase (penicillin-binding protein 5/6)